MAHSLVDTCLPPSFIAVPIHSAGTIFPQMSTNAITLPRDQANQDADQPRTRARKRPFTRQRYGCLTCRQRRKKCDCGTPVCGDCSRLNLVCEREAPRKIRGGSTATTSTKTRAQSDDSLQSHPSRLSASKLTNIGAPPVPRALDVVRPNNECQPDLSDSRRHMLRYYTTTLAEMLTTNTENNCFISVLLPMAFDCPVLLDAVTALASRHLSISRPEFEDIALRHRGRVLSSFKILLEDDKSSSLSEMRLAIAIVMCATESISDGTSNDWTYHLAGAAACLQQQQRLAANNSGLSHAVMHEPHSLGFEAKWLLRSFAYHDALTSISLNRRPLIEGDYWMSTENAMADPYCAYASRVIFSLSELSVLKSDYESANLTGDLTGQADHQQQELILIRRAQSIIDDLRRWECIPSNTGVTSPHDEPLALLSEAYRSAALIYFASCVPPHVFAAFIPEGILPHVESICNLSEQIHEGALVESSLLFPLFIAGNEATTPRQISVIRNRLVAMNKWRRFRHVDACVEILDEVWTERWKGSAQSPFVPVAWQDILKRKGWQLALF